MNLLRKINERYENSKLFSIDSFYLLIVIVGIPQILSYFLKINIRFLGFFYIILGISLFIENYYFLKKKEKLK